ncbi:hypothetical protein [Flaviaesturariibacter amylovorans]|uniref:Lipocalin-like domain-containing protein n=1 Tax=Flaviaesturariibacter amylovorans TaxID=1084520 RepID=A0ABP8GCR6_9BACT
MRFLLLLFPLLACRRDPAPPAFDATLLNGTYRKLYETAGEQNLWCTYYHDTCALDNRYRFEASGAFTVVDAGIPCTLPEERGGAWRLKGDSLQLPDGAYRVLRLDAQELRLEALRQRNGFRMQVAVGYRRE